MSTRITTGKVRLSYAHVWEPREAQNGGKPKYSTAILIPKTDTTTVQAIQQATQEAAQEGAAKYGTSWPSNIQGLKTPLRDGDVERADDPIYAGHHFLNASSVNPPSIVDQMAKKLDPNVPLDREQVYSGVYARVIFDLYAYNTSGNRGIGAGLQAIQKWADGERLSGGGVDGEKAFAPIPGATPASDTGGFGLLD